ncbi:MAG: hypothetical protein AB8C02_01410 [Halioglobus sp.]
MCSNRAAKALAPQAGVALAILVWFIAAMSLLVGAVVMQARVDVKLTQLHAAKARAVALGDGAINLALAEMLVLENQGDLESRRAHFSTKALGGFTVRVTFTPVTGLIDLNMAPLELLVAVFMGAGNIDENVARELAISVVEWRTSGGDDEEGSAAMRFGRFEAIEDLLLVPGINRTLFEVLRESVYVSQNGQSALDVMAAPESVLLALGMSEEDSQQYIQERRGGDGMSVGIPESIDPAFLSQSSLSSYRADAVIYVDETTFLRRRWVDRVRTGEDGLPWRFYRTEATRALTSKLSESLQFREVPDAQY